MKDLELKIKSYDFWVEVGDTEIGLELRKQLKDKQ